MSNLSARSLRLLLAAIPISSLALAAGAQGTLPPPVEVSQGWQLQNAAHVSQEGAKVSSASFDTKGWYAATVPGTVLTTLVNNGVYPEPLYGENNRPTKIPDSLSKNSYWYRTVVKVPSTYSGEHIWINFDGVNYSSTIYVNGSRIASTHGAFVRGKFEISSHVTAGKNAVIAVLVAPQPHPGKPVQQTLRAGVGANGGVTAADGPTFLSTIGWDWIPGIHDRDTGIWRKVFLSATGSVLIKDPLVTTDLPLPQTDSSDISVSATIENVTGQTQTGVLHGTIGNITFQQSVSIGSHATETIKFTPATTPALRMANPLLWWPNGYGPQNLYDLHLELDLKNHKSPADAQDVSFGVRKITYAVPDSKTLTVSVNGVPIFIRGGNWGMDEAMKRIPIERLDAQIHMHQIANLNLIRNWVGQSTNEDFYALCDKYGILVWDEFFQPNPNNGPNPDDVDVYIANVRDKILHFRNHPSIAIWCARNEGFPPKEIDDKLRTLMAELEPTRYYQADSNSGGGVRSDGPYAWRTPRAFYTITDDYFKTETGSVSIPTFESIHGMMPQKDWLQITDDWAEHDFTSGAQKGNLYPGILASRYGPITNLADFARKGQLMNYEAFRAMYEGRNAKLFNPATGVITWMSNPAQPSFVWQLYHYDLEPNSSLFAVRSAGELVHVQLNELNGHLQIINNLPDALDDAAAEVSIYNLDGTLASQKTVPVSADSGAVLDLGPVQFPSAVSAVHFLELQLHDASGNLVSRNFYWLGSPAKPDDLTALNTLPTVPLQATVDREDANGKFNITVTLLNGTTDVALMAHVQLRRQASGERVLPVFYDNNYVSLVPNESTTIHIQGDVSDLQGDDALVVLDGWNTTVTATTEVGVSIASNVEAQPGSWPATGLPFQTKGLE
jgi:hypothetical protein